MDADFLDLADDSQAMKFLGADFGSLGPVNLPKDMLVLADQRISYMKNAVVGANQNNYHYINANVDRDFKVDKFSDLAIVHEGELSPDGKGNLKFTRGIEIGHIFKLGTRYSENFGANILDENGRSQPIIMGSYGIGISRLLSAISEQNADEDGLIWPETVAPFDVHVIPINYKDTEQEKIASNIEDKLGRMGLSVLVDDRNERPGVKFADVDLIGIPLRVTIGKQTVDEGAIEIKLRKTSEIVKTTMSDVAPTVNSLLKRKF